MVGRPSQHAYCCSSRETRGGCLCIDHRSSRPHRSSGFTKKQNRPCVLLGLIEIWYRRSTAQDTHVPVGRKSDKLKRPKSVPLNLSLWDPLPWGILRSMIWSFKIECILFHYKGGGCGRCEVSRPLLPFLFINWTSPSRKAAQEKARDGGWGSGTLGAPVRAEGSEAAGLCPLLPLPEGHPRPLPRHLLPPRLPHLALLRSAFPPSLSFLVSIQSCIKDQILSHIQ